jgi:hypothetical protein
MNKYHIRFNTKHGDSPFFWRVFENGVEHLVRNIDIRVPVFGESTVEGDVVKWNIACHGSMAIIDEIATIT